MIFALVLMSSSFLSAAAKVPTTWTPDPGERIAIVGNTFAERMHSDGQFETRLQASYPGHDLSIRNFGWSGDELQLQPRPHNFIGMDAWLDRHRTSTIIGCFGMNESFAGDGGLAEFRKDLSDWISHYQSRIYDGAGPPDLILVSPIAHEDLGPPLPNGVERNFVLARYVDTMREIAARRGIIFIDLHTPTRLEMSLRDDPLTINGIHLNEAGYRFVACEMADQLGLTVPDQSATDAFARSRAAALRAAIVEKNRLHFQRWRPTNTEYVYGRRHEPFGSQNFPAEMQTLDVFINEAEQKIWALPPGSEICLSSREPY